MRTVLKRIAIVFMFYLCFSITLAAALPSPNQPPAINAPKPNPQVQLPASTPNTLTTDAVRITRTELERDVYKQAVESSQKSVDNTKCLFTYTFTAIGLILTAMGIILALFGFAAFRETKKYEEATVKAEKAAENAQKYEQQAKGILDDISTKANKELDKIRDEGKKQVRKLIAEAEIERIITESWNEGLRAKDPKEYEAVQIKYAQLIEQNPNEYKVYSHWCATVADWAKRDKNVELFNEAHKIYNKLKTFAYAHKDDVAVRTEQVSAGGYLANAYIEAGKIPEAKALLDEVEPLTKELPEGKDRQFLVDWIVQLRQKAEMQ